METGLRRRSGTEQLLSEWREKVLLLEVQRLIECLIGKTYILHFLLV